MSELSEKALEIAITQLGVHEIGSTNTGPQVNEYLAAVGEPPGLAWCCAFATWAVIQAAHQIGYQPLLMPKTASCEVLREWAEKAGKLHTTPQVGDIALWLDPNHCAHHAMIVRLVTTHGFTTVEGNEGNAVRSLTRALLAGRYVFLEPQ